MTKFDSAKYQYDHIAIIIDKPRDGGIYFPEFKIWTSDYQQSEFRIEWICFDKDCKFHPLIQSVSHVCFVVKNIQEAVKGRKILMEPFLLKDLWIAFIEDNGAVIEFFQPIK